MLQRYNHLKITYQEEGFEKALQSLEQSNPKTNEEEILDLNLYIYIITQQKYKLPECTQLLKQCLGRECSPVLKTLTSYHLSYTYYLLQHYQDSNKISQEAVNLFYPQYYILKNRIDRSLQDNLFMEELAQALCYCFDMLAKTSKVLNKENQALKFSKVVQKLIKDNINISFTNQSNQPQRKSNIVSMQTEGNIFDQNYHYQ